MNNRNNIFDQLPDELLVPIIKYANNQKVTRVSKRFRNNHAEAMKLEAKENFIQYLQNKSLDINKIGVNHCLFLIKTFAINNLPQIEDSHTQASAIGILMLQLFEVMQHLTENHRASFTMKRDDGYLAAYAATHYHQLTNGESRTKITPDDIETLKEDAADLFTLLTHNDHSVNTRYLPQLIFSFLAELKEGLQDTRHDLTMRNFHTFFYSPENNSLKTIRLVNMTICLLESCLTNIGYTPAPADNPYCAIL